MSSKKIVRMGRKKMKVDLEERWKIAAQDQKDGKLFDSRKQKKTRPHGAKEKKRIFELEKKI